ncbi:hypothetical protein [Aeromicrobium sp. CTD01-1L150]|uniref:hypothetical protein n=1 Tax=Aeromicrobium sp. CTD01-1L150 TaxID=3341830 RepID=UPI0035C24FCE
MSRRRGRPRPHRAAWQPSSHEVQQRRDGEWNVRRLSGASSNKTYTCPGCLHPIAPATPHVLVWPVEKSLLSADAIDERRHWHRDCWHRRP